MTNAVKVATTSTKPATTAAVTPNLAPFPSRLLDAPPYYGGTEIGVPNFPSAGSITICTAAFSNALARMLSAGHCFPINKVVQQGYFDSATLTWTATGNMGKVDWVQWGNNRPDAEEINPSLVGSQPVASRIYNTLTTSVAAVGTVFPHAIGAPFCADGAFTGENCKSAVDSSPCPPSGRYWSPAAGVPARTPPRRSGGACSGRSRATPRPGARGSCQATPAIPARRSRSGYRARSPYGSRPP